MASAEEVKKNTILVVDDVAVNLTQLVEILRQAGYRVRPAASGGLALQSARLAPPDLILLDVLMPDLDGFEVCRQLKADTQTRGIPIIFLSAIDDAGHVVQGFELGAIDYLSKPIEARELIARITAHLDRHRLQLRLLQRLQSHESQSDDSARSRFQHVDKITAYLLKHLAAEHSLDELASMACSNRATLNEQFQHLFGMSVFEWLHEQRMQHAAYLLGNSREQIQQIASDVGYHNSTAFSTAFKRRFGLSPRAYRDTVHA